MYHIVYVSDKNYILQCAVSLLSLLRNSKQDSFFVVHLVEDGSLEECDYRLFDRIRETVDDFELKVHRPNDSEIDIIDYSKTVLNKMTMYRLLLPSLLADVNECLYIDCDTLVVGDITQVFQSELEDYLLGGVLDSVLIEETDYCPAEMNNRFEYINAGVLLLNLEKMRECNTQSKFLELVSQNYHHMDQDIINVACEGKIFFLDSIYNSFSFLRINNPCVIHFAGGNDCRPWRNTMAKYSDEWWAYASLFSDSSQYKQCKSLADSFTKEYFQMSLVKAVCEYKSVYVFGAGKYGRIVTDAFKVNGISVKAVLDNSSDSHFFDVDMKRPEDVPYTKDSVVVISVQNPHVQKDMKQQLTELGWVEKQVKVYRPITQSSLRYIDEKYVESIEKDIESFSSGSEKCV